MAVQDRAVAEPAVVLSLPGGGQAALAAPTSIRPSPWRILVGLFVGGLAALLVAAARLNGLVHGWPAVALFAVLILALPTSRNLSRRILLAGCLLFGWVPVLWWWRLPLGDLGHAGLLLAGTAGLLAGWVVGGPDPVRRLGRIVPRFRLVDLFPIVAGGVAAWVMGTWLQVRTGIGALSLLVPGWDFSVHVFITAMIRIHGVTMDTLPPPPDGSGWAANQYPQGFHAVAATLIELMTSPGVGTASAETIAFVEVAGLTVVALVTLVSAGICAAPQLRRRPALALPVVTLVSAWFLLGPGIGAVANGHVNFVLACALVAAMPLIIWPMPRVVMPIQLAALGGALVGVAHNWALLMTMAAPACLALLLPLRRSRWRARVGAWTVAAAIWVATLYGVLRAAALIARIPSGADMLTYAGGVVIPPLGQVLALAFASTAVCLTARRSRSGRAAGLALAPVGGLITMAMLAYQQLQVGTILQYYFWKYAVAVELVSLVLLTLIGTALLPRYGGVFRPAVPSATVSTDPSGRTPARRRGGTPWAGSGSGARLRAGAASLIAAIGLTQAFGYSAPGTDAVGVARVSLGQARLQQWRQHAQDPMPVAMRLFAALDVQQRHPGSTVVYLELTSRDQVLMANTNQWYQALNRNWTVATNDLDATLSRPLTSLDQLASAARAVLNRDERTVVVVSPEWQGLVQKRLSPTLRDRVLSW
jgi:hypothetical protein